MRGRLTTLALVGLVALTATTFPAVAKQGVTDKEIVLGDIVPLTGPPALLGVAHNLGVRVAIAEANEAGGINGRQIRLISEDDGYVPSRTIQGVRKLINSDKVFALTAVSGTAQSLAAMPLFKQSGIPAMAPITTHRGLYDPIVDNIFVVGYDMADAVSELVAQMADRYPGKKWAIISQDDDYGEDVRRGFDKVVKDKNLDVVSRQIFKKGQTDFSSEILQVRQSGADVLMAGGVLGENVTMARELERIGHRIPMGVTYVSRVPAAVKLMGSAAENVYVMDYVYLEDQPEAQEFMDKIRKYLSTDEQARVNRYTFTGYASTRALIEAMRACGDDLTWKCTIDQLNQLSDLETGTMTPLTFTPDDHLAAPRLFLLKADPSIENYRVVQ